MNRSTRARVLALVVAAGVAGGALCAAAGPAGAKISAADCETLQELSDNTPDVESGSDSLYGERAAAVGVGFAETAQDVKDKKLRKAMQRMAAFYKDAADADSATEAVALALKAGKSYGKATAVWAKAQLECITSSITIPTVPSNITLPGNITIPTIPRIPSR